MPRTGYPCDEEAKSQIKKTEVPTRPAIAGSHDQDGGAKRGGPHSKMEAGTRVDLSRPR